VPILFGSSATRHANQQPRCCRTDGAEPAGQDLTQATCCTILPLSARAWSVEYTDEFERWWDTLTEDDQEAIDAAIELLEERGPALGRPLADNVHQSRHGNMKELRPTSTVRVLFAFDPRRTAILLIGGNKAGAWNRWYDQYIPLADTLYDDHLHAIETEQTEGGSTDG
jgi:hypothetical protein